MATRIGLLLFDDVEVLDACGPFEVFSVAGRVAARAGAAAPFELVTLSDGATVAGVCTAAFPLALAGLLDGRAATTHRDDLAELRRRFPAVEVVGDVRYLDHGDVATSAGVSAGIDLALHLVARLAGEDLAVATARQMDYPWTREPAGAVR